MEWPGLLSAPGERKRSTNSGRRAKCVVRSLLCRVRGLDVGDSGLGVAGPRRLDQSDGLALARRAHVVVVHFSWGGFFFFLPGSQRILLFLGRATGT